MSQSWSTCGTSEWSCHNPTQWWVWQNCVGNQRS